MYYKLNVIVKVIDKNKERLISCSGLIQAVDDDENT